MTVNDISLTQDERESIREYIVINETVKRLEKNKKKLTEDVKKIFNKYNIQDPLDFEGSTLTVTDSVRKTVTKKTKDQFIIELIKLGKNYLLTQSIDIDTDTIYSEYESGSIDKELIEKYMSIAHVKTLTCK